MRAGQRDGVLLLFLAVFLFCLAVVPGQSLWGAIQGFLLGVFGWCVFLWIGLLVYFAVLFIFAPRAEAAGGARCAACPFHLVAKQRLTYSGP